MIYPYLFTLSVAIGMVTPGVESVSRVVHLAPMTLKNLNKAGGCIEWTNELHWMAIVWIFSLAAAPWASAFAHIPGPAPR